MMESSIRANERSSLMTDSPLPRTTSSSLRGNRGRYDLTTPPPAEHISLKPEMMGTQYGWVKIISPEKRWQKNWSKPYVLTQCQGCGAIQWQNLENLMSGGSKGCQACSQKKMIPSWLSKRLTSAKQRCENPKDKGYKNYGARGIKFDFPSVTIAGLYLVREFGPLNRKMELDRIDTNGNYAPGNLRLADHRTNCVNQRRNVLSYYDPQYWPYARSVVTRKLSQGMTREEIIQDAEKAVFEKRKNWRGIQARLKSMTYEMPEDIIVLPYRES